LKNRTLRNQHKKLFTYQKVEETGTKIVEIWDEQTEKWKKVSVPVIKKERLKRENYIPFKTWRQQNAA